MHNAARCFSVFFLHIYGVGVCVGWFVNVKQRILKDQRGCGAPTCPLSNAAFAANIRMPVLSSVVVTLVERLQAI